MRNGTTENPNGVISVPLIVSAPLRLDQAPRAALEDAEDDEAQPERGERDADDVELRLRVRGRERLQLAAGMSRMTATITTSPANT